MATKNLGDILLEQGVIDRSTLNRALALQKRRLGEILIQESLADPVAIANALKLQAQSPSQSRNTRLDFAVRDFDELLLRFERLEDELRGSTSSATYASSLVALREKFEQMLLDPIAKVFERARVVASQLAERLKIKVRVDVSGAELLVDRALIEDLSDLVLHLIRNALAHGIDSPNERAKAGKPPLGTITLAASIQHGKLELTIRDDGRGLDFIKVLKRAKKMKLVASNVKKLTFEEVKQIIFTAGFSTAKKTTEAAGRGVGLDVVEAGAKRLRGVIEVTSVENEYTEFKLVCPLSCARAQVVPLKVKDQWVAVLAGDISKIEKVESSEFLKVVDFGAPSEPHSNHPVFGVTANHGSRWAFDEVGSPEFALVRQTPDFKSAHVGVIGHARLTDGRTVLMLDLDELEV